MIKKFINLKKTYLTEKSFTFYLCGISIFLFYFIYTLFDKSILIEKNVLSILFSYSIFIFFLIGFFIDSKNFIRNIWANFYGKILHFFIASLVYAISYSLAEKIIYINTELDPNLLQSSLHLFSALLNLPVWILTFQIFLLVYTLVYIAFFLILIFISYILLITRFVTKEIFKIFGDLFPSDLISNLIDKNKRLRVNFKIIKKRVTLGKKIFIKKCIHSLFFIIGATIFIVILPMDKLLLNSQLLKDNNIIKEAIIFTSFYKANNNSCKNINKNELVRFYGNSFSKAIYYNDVILFINNIECEK